MLSGPFQLYPVFTIFLQLKTERVKESEVIQRQMLLLLAHHNIKPTLYRDIFLTHFLMPGTCSVWLIFPGSFHHFFLFGGDFDSLETRLVGPQPSWNLERQQQRDCARPSSARQRGCATENRVLLDKLTLLRAWMKLTHSWSIRQLAGIQQARK